MINTCNNLKSCKENASLNEFIETFKPDEFSFCGQLFASMPIVTVPTIGKLSVGGFFVRVLYSKDIQKNTWKWKLLTIPVFPIITGDWRLPKINYPIFEESTPTEKIDRIIKKTIDEALEIKKGDWKKDIKLHSSFFVDIRCYFSFDGLPIQNCFETTSIWETFTKKDAGCPTTLFEYNTAWQTDEIKLKKLNLNTHSKFFMQPYLIQTTNHLNILGLRVGFKQDFSLKLNLKMITEFENSTQIIDEISLQTGVAKENMSIGTWKWIKEKLNWGGGNIVGPFWILLDGNWPKEKFGK